jgi:hypothetical protein
VNIEAARRALREKRPIAQDDVIAAIADRPPSLSSDSESPRRPIGF